MASSSSGAADAPSQHHHLPLHAALLRLYEAGPPASPSRGLVAIASSLPALTRRIEAPRRRAMVLVVGNHSSGKSTFLNWYCERPVQSTGVAVETSSFVVLRQGPAARGVESHMGDTALLGLPALRAAAERLPFEERHACVSALVLKRVASSARRFQDVDLVDSPGLVDGGVRYDLDPARAICVIAAECDVVLAFFDPIGQALCRRTVDCVKSLTSVPVDLHFCLTKIDTVTSRLDLAKVSSQLVSVLTTAIGAQHIGFELLPICMPLDKSKHQPDDDAEPYGPGNALHRLEEAIERAVEGRLAKNLAKAREDAAALAAALDAELAQERKRQSTAALLRRAAALLLLVTTASTLLLLLELASDGGLLDSLSLGASSLLPPLVVADTYTTAAAAASWVLNACAWSSRALRPMRAAALVHAGIKTASGRCAALLLVIACVAVVRAALAHLAGPRFDGRAAAARLQALRNDRAAVAGAALEVARLLEQHVNSDADGGVGAAIRRRV